MSVIQTSASDQPDRQPRRTKGSKATSRRKSDIAEKPEKGSWYVWAEARKRLKIHATMEGRSESDVLNEQLMALNRYAMPALLTRTSRPSQPTTDVEDDRQDIAG